MDNQDNAAAFSTGDQIRVRYTSDAGTQRTEDVTYPSRRGRDVEPTVTGQASPQSGDVVPISVGRNAVTIEEEGTASDITDEFVTRPATEQDYDPLVADVTRYALVPGMSVANDTIWLGSRYRGRVYENRGELSLAAGSVDQQRPGEPDRRRREARREVIGHPGRDRSDRQSGHRRRLVILSYGNGFLSAFANAGGGGLGTDVEPPIGPFGREGAGGRQSRCRKFG